MDGKLEFKLISLSLVLISEVIAKSQNDYSYFKETSANLFKKKWFKEESIEESNRKKCEIIASNMHLMQVFIFQFPKDFDLGDVDIKILMETKTKLSDEFFENSNKSFDLQLLSKFIKVNTRHDIDDMIDWLPFIPIASKIYIKRINDYPNIFEAYPGIDLFEFSQKAYSFIFEKDGLLNDTNVESNLLFSNVIPTTNSFCVDIAKQQTEIDSQ